MSSSTPSRRDRRLLFFGSVLSALLLLSLPAFAANGETSNFGILSLLPPIIAIGLCIISKEVIPSLFLGIWVAGTMIAGGNPIAGFGNAVASLWDNLGGAWSARIVLTSLTMGGLVGIMRVGGGIDAVVQWITNKINSVKGALLMTELAGFIIFFEDYVNTLVVGTTMTPITARYNISKEKLSYIVDSTAAPIACIAGISSWIAYMVGQIGNQFSALEIDSSPYVAYLSSIPYIFYNILALILMTFCILTLRDFGPMLKAERRARRTGKIIRDDAEPLINVESDDLIPAEKTPRRLVNFVIPIISLIGLIFTMLIVTGGWPGVGVREAIGAGSSSKALVWGAFGSVFITLVFYRAQGVTTWKYLFRGYMEGMRSIFFGTLILIFAWGIGSSIKAVGAPQFIVGIAGDTLAPMWIPFITFIMGAAISFSAGTSYGTMAVLMPIVVPLAYTVSQNAGVDPMQAIIPTIGAVFGGAVWGDHCSPISDTTVMSSMFTGSDHMDHVNSQAPYALVSAAGALAGYAGVALGLPVLVDLLIGIAVALGIFWIISSKVDDGTTTAEQAA
ncbi:MAG: Na+/H+ antiporter NhaC family protein [Synergistales bacterium]|nr:Na+/H+ antiporter NhaC family protein [Synergistales bacterium]